MSDKLNMDKQIREKLEDFSFAPPPHVFNNVQAQLAAKRKRVRMAYIGFVTAAAVVVFAFIAGWNLNNKRMATQPALVEQEMILSPKKQEPETLGNNLGNTRIAKAETVEPKQSIALETALETEIEKNTTASVVNELGIENTFVTSFERVSFELMESLEAFWVNENKVALAQPKTIAEPILSINNNDAALIAENARNYQKQKGNDKGWIVGAHLSPGYSSQSTEYSEQYASNMDYSSDNGNGNVGGGLSIQYKTSKRLRVESGLYYSQNGRSSDISLKGMFDFGSRDNEMLAMDAGYGDDITSAPSFSNTVQTSTDGITMNSTAGVINMQTTPKGSSIETYDELLNAKNTNTLTTNGEFSQEFEFVEIPLYVRYSVLDKKFGIEILGGINAGLIVGNNAYVDNDFGKQNVGSTEDISTLNLSGTFGVGMNYALGKHFSLAMEPRFNYYFNSINTNTNVTYKPYRIGFYTGIYYEF